MSIWLKLAARNMAKRKLRTVLTILGIAFGVALVFGVNTTKSSTLDSFIGLIDTLGGKSELIITNTSSTGFKKKIATDVSKVKGVKEAIPSISSGIFLLQKDKKESLEFLGVDPSIDQKIRKYNLASGRFLKQSDKSKVLLNADFAKQKGLKLGSKVSFVGSKGIKEFEVAGMLKSTGVGHAARGLIAISTLEDSQELLSFENKINKVDVTLKNKDEFSGVKKRIDKVLGSGYEVKRPASRGKSISSSLDFLIASFNFFSFIVLMAGAFLILNTLRMSIQERQAQIGTLKTLGSSRKQILLMVLLETLLIAGVGIVLGIGLGWFISYSMIGAFAAIYQTKIIEVSFSIYSMANAVVLGMIVSVLAGLIPAIRASKITPMNAIALSKRARLSWFEKRGGFLGILMLIIAGSIYWLSKTTSSNSIAGLFVFAAAIFIAPLFVQAGSLMLRPLFMLVGTEGTMAIRNFVRTKSRSSAAVAAIISSLVLILMIGELGLSQDRVIKRFIDQIFSYEVIMGKTPYSLVDINKYPALPLKTVEDVKKIKGVGPIHYAKFLPVKVEDRNYFATFMSARPKGFKEMKEGEAVTAFNKLADGRSVVISTTVSTKLNKHLGDFLKVKTIKGWRKFKITGTYVDLANNGESISFSMKALKLHFDEEGIDIIEVAVQKGYSYNSVKKAIIDKIGKPRGILVALSSSERENIMKVSDQFTAVQRSLIALAILVSALGIINILVMNVMERRREIGILRAVGFLKGQLRKTVILEAQAIGLVGSLLGIVFGLIMAWILIIMANNISDYGYEFIFPRQEIVVALFIALGVSLIASLYPASKAAKTNIVEALRYE